LSSGERKGRVVAEEPTIRVVLLAVDLPTDDLDQSGHDGVDQPRAAHGTDPRPCNRLPCPRRHVCAQGCVRRKYAVIAVQMPPSDVFVHGHTTLRLRSGKTA
jgi:hypothetical protein